MTEGERIRLKAAKAAENRALRSEVYLSYLETASAYRYASGDLSVALVPEPSDDGTLTVSLGDTLSRFVQTRNADNDRF